MKLILETRRMILREMTIDDLEFLFQIDTDPDIMRYYYSSIKSYPEVRIRLEGIIKNYRKEEGFGIWLAEEKRSKERLGVMALKRIEDNPAQEIEIGYKFEKSYWNQGYATEAAIALLKYGFENKGLEKIVAVTNPANNPSVNVMKKLGMEFEKMAYFYNGNMVYYSITAERYGNLSTLAAISE